MERPRIEPGSCNWHKGQTSIEYVILLAVSIIFFLLIIVIAYQQFADIGQVKSRDISINSLKQIAGAAKEVYLQGSSAQKTVVVTFPPDVRDNSLTIVNNSLHINHAGTDISIPVEFPIYGNLPNASGTYEIVLVSEGSAVRIGLSEFSVSPSSISFSFCQSNGSQSSSQNITFTNLQGYPINISLATDWTYTNVTLSVSNSSLSLAAYASQTVTVSTTVSMNVTGTYPGFIDANTSNTSLSIPVTVETLDCTCAGGPGAPSNATCTNVSYVRIKTYSNSTYLREKVAFSLPPDVMVTALGWTPNATVTVDIRNPSNLSVPGYPTNAVTNSTGGYATLWTATGAYGIYNIIMNDSSFTANKTINVVQCSG